MLNRILTCKTKAIKVYLNGGLGNQLFQFAAATSLAIENKSQLIFVESNKKWPFKLGFLQLQSNVSYSPIVINNNLIFSKVRHRQFCLYENYNEKAFNYSKIKLVNSHTNLHGYYQSEKYFCSYSDQIRSFVMKSLMNLGYISQHNNVLQIRMGDMARDKSVRKVHGIISANYLSKALYGLSIDPKEWVVISDDFDSIQEELPGFAHLNIRNVVSKSDLEDLFVLSQAKNLIISNSTFGWWGAWLSEGQVVAPMNWFTAEGLAMRPVVDLFPSDWKLM